MPRQVLGLPVLLSCCRITFQDRPTNTIIMLQEHVAGSAYQYYYHVTGSLVQQVNVCWNRVQGCTIGGAIAQRPIPMMAHMQVLGLALVMSS